MAVWIVIQNGEGPGGRVGAQFDYPRHAGPKPVTNPALGNVVGDVFTRATMEGDVKEHRSALDSQL